LSKRHAESGKRAPRLLWFLVLALAAALAVLAAGCGGGDEEEAAPAPAPAEPAPAEPPPAETTAPAEETTAPAEEPAAAGGGSIWVLLPDSTTSPRWETDDRRFFEQSFTDAGVDHTIVNAEGDAATQQSQAEQAIAEGASVILLVSLDTGSGATIIDLAKEAGVQVVEYDRFNTGSSGGAAYVSFDNVKVGATMAEVLEPAIDALGKSPAQVVELNGGEEDNNAFLFKDGYDATVQKHVDDGSWALAADQFVPGWGANGEGQGIMEQILTDANNNIDAVFAANDNLAQQAINALEAAGVGPVPLSGQDATAAGIQNILLGKQTMTVYKPIEAEAAVAAAVALALQAGEDVTTVSSDFEFSLIGINSADGKPADAPTGDGVVPYFALTPIGVTVDNIADTVIADGFRTIEEVCTGDTMQTDFCKENA
jgi:D-xylose transport system substrate-binding protein